jgi:hypothetical protein
MGRMVIYNHPGSLDGKHKPMQSPAMIQRVNEDGTLFLWVFGPYGISFNPSIKQGDGPSEWNWPVLV